MPSDEKVVGLYLGSDAILRNPGYLEALKEGIGLNLVILNFNGELPDQVQAANPFDGTPPSDTRIRELICRHVDGTPCTEKLESAKRSLGPHVSPEHDEDGLRRAIEEAHQLGVKVWLLGGGWTSSDFDVLMYCPGKEVVNSWYEAVYTHMASYGADGLDITHARYPMTSFPRGMFLCCCEDCTKAAGRLGYDMEAMVADIQDAYVRLKKTNSKRLINIARSGLGVFDMFQLLGMQQGVLDWFRFRAELLETNLKRFRRAVHHVGGEGFVFGTDTYPASLSMLVGHNHARWSQFSDFASPLLSHVDIFPMMTLTRWAEFFQANGADFTEAEALEIVYQISGYGQLDLPGSTKDFALGEPDCEFRNIPLEDIVALDMQKARLYLPDGIPSYPIIQGGGAPHDWPIDVVKKLHASALAGGHNGVIYQGTKLLVDFDLK